MSNNCLGFPWFHRNNYKELIRIFDDSHLMPNNYEEWIKFAEEGLDRLKKDGLAIQLVDIDPVTFAKWCQEKGLPADAKARMAFSDEFVAQE